MSLILAINPGSTSTKIAVYQDEAEVFIRNLKHTEEDLKPYEKIKDQFQFRKMMIMDVLKENHIELSSLDVVVGRGGLINPVESGAYLVNEELRERLKYPLTEHASNLGGLIAFEIGKEYSIPAYIYDSVAVDEMEDISRITGLPEIERPSLSHALNMRAVSMEAAKKIGGNYNEYNFIVAHLGGGITLSVHKKGKIVDIVSDDEGPMSPERAGNIPTRWLIDLIFRNDFDKAKANAYLRGNAGLKGYLGTANAIEIEDMIKNGNEKAKLLFEAMALQVAKYIAQLSAVVNGEVDRIILTGGIAYSKLFTDMVEKRVKFIAPIEIIAGENEMRSLAYGALRVLRGEESAKEYTDSKRNKLF